MSDRESRPELPDEEYEDYESDAAEKRESLEREAGLTAFGGPAFGSLFGEPEEQRFGADENP